MKVALRAAAVGLGSAGTAAAPSDTPRLCRCSGGSRGSRPAAGRSPGQGRQKAPAAPGQAGRYSARPPLLSKQLLSCTCWPWARQPGRSLSRPPPPRVCSPGISSRQRQELSALPQNPVQQTSRESPWGPSPVLTARVRLRPQRTLPATRVCRAPRASTAPPLQCTLISKGKAH